MSQNERTPDEEFGEVLKRYQDAVDAREPHEAESAVCEIFALAEQWSDQNPAPESELSMAASGCAERGDWAGAEALYRKVLSLPDLQPMFEYRAHSDLAGLLHRLKRSAEASAEEAQATAAARRTDVPILLIMALVDQASCLLTEHRFEEATPVIAEALLMSENDRAYGQLRAQALLARTRCALHSGALAAAACDLDEAFHLLSALAAVEMAGGAQQCLARYWSLTAALHEARRDYGTAVDAWQRAVEISKHVAALPHCAGVYAQLAVADMLAGLAAALTRLGRTADAETCNQEHASIVKNAGVG